MMQKHIDPAFLNDNADKTEEIEYFLEFTDEQLETFKGKIADTSLLISEIEEEKKQAASEYNERLKEPKAEIKELHSNYKDKGKLVNERCYMFIDPEANEVCYYNQLGNLVKFRDCKPEERQHRLNLSQTGTSF